MQNKQSWWLYFYNLDPPAHVLIGMSACAAALCVRGLWARVTGHR